MRETVEHLRNVVSLAVWVPFNEGWGQFDAAEVAREVAALDPTRTVDHASGWHDQGGGDLRSLHVYFRRFRVPGGGPRRAAGGAASVDAAAPGRDRRALVLSEYGGYTLRVDGHTFGSAEFGYKRCRTAAELAEAFTRLHDEQIVPAIRAGLRGHRLHPASRRGGRAERPVQLRPAGAQAARGGRPGRHRPAAAPGGLSPVPAAAPAGLGAGGPRAGAADGRSLAAGAAARGERAAAWATRVPRTSPGRLAC